MNKSLSQAMFAGQAYELPALSEYTVVEIFPEVVEAMAIDFSDYFD